MSLTQGLRSLSRGALSAKSALPRRAGVGGPVKLNPPIDKPLPYNYDFWWDNGIYPGQPIYDGMFGPVNGNLSTTFHYKCWALVAPVMLSPWIYEALFDDDMSKNPMVPRQFPEEVRDFLNLYQNSHFAHDYSQGDYEITKRRADGIMTPLY